MLASHTPLPNLCYANTLRLPPACPELNVLPLKAPLHGNGHQLTTQELPTPTTQL